MFIVVTVVMNIVRATTALCLSLSVVCADYGRVRLRTQIRRFCFDLRIYCTRKAAQADPAFQFPFEKFYV